MIKTINNLPLFAMDIDSDLQGVKIISLVDFPAIQQDFLKFSDENEIKLKADEERHVVTGPALIPDLPIYRKDDKGQGFYITFSKEVIEKIALKYFVDCNNNNVNLMHEYGVDGCTYFESYLKDDERGICPVEFKDLPDGTWFVSCKIENPDVWELVKSGVLKGFSIEGMLSRTPVEESINSLDELIKYLNN